MISRQTLLAMAGTASFFLIVVAIILAIKFVPGLEFWPDRNKISKVTVEDDWVTFRSNELGFAVSRPASWSVEDAGMSGRGFWAVIFESPKVSGTHIRSDTNIRIIVQVSPKTYLSAGEWVDKDYAERGRKYRSRRTITLAGQPAIELDTSRSNLLVTMLMRDIILKDKHGRIVEILFMTAQGYPHAETTLQRFLGSFRLL